MRCFRRASRSAISASPSSTSSIGSACISASRSARRARRVDILVMTATPIPRTLVLTYFGDMDVSTLREKPAGRQPIDTRALPLERLDEVIDRGRPRDRRRRAGLLGLPAGRGKRDARCRRRGGALRRACARFSATAVGLLHGTHEGARQGRRHGRLRRAARRRSWSRRR